MQYCKNSLSLIINSFRNKRLCKEIKPNKWKMRNPPSNSSNLQRVSRVYCPNSINSSVSKTQKDFIAIGKRVDWLKDNQPTDSPWI